MDTDLCKTLAAELATCLEIHYPTPEYLWGAWSEAVEALQKSKLLLEEAGFPVPDAVLSVLAIAGKRPVEVHSQGQSGHNEPG